MLHLSSTSKEEQNTALKVLFVIFSSSVQTSQFLKETVQVVKKFYQSATKSGESALTSAQRSEFVVADFRKVCRPFQPKSILFERGLLPLSNRIRCCC